MVALAVIFIPKASASLWSTGIEADERCIGSARSRSTMLTTNSPVRSMFVGVSFFPPSLFAPGPKATRGGRFPSTLKKLYGARLIPPHALKVDTQAMGRGTTSAVSTLAELFHVEVHGRNLPEIAGCTTALYYSGALFNPNITCDTVFCPAQILLVFTLRW
jgi:hypothetical protein